jgi:transcriptional regulator with XRE-family HTH domain
MTIGERLEEARKRKGISLREASEITKIRSDILHGMENNETEYLLPDVYIRGFLRNYSSFLNLDSENILTDFTAMQLRNTQPVRSESREYLGQMNIADKVAIEPQRSSFEDDPPKPDDRQISTTNVYKSSIDRDLYYKVAMVFGGTFLLVFIIIMIVNLIISDDVPEINPDLREDSITAGTNEIFNEVAPMDEEQIKIIALDDVTVIVEQRIDKKRLYSGTLAEGESVSLTKIGPIKISFTEGENVIVEKDGKNFKMGVTGINSRILD